MTQILKSALWLLLVIIWTVIFSVSMPCLLLNIKYCYWIPRIWTGVIFWLLKTIVGLDFKIEGKIPTTKKSYIIACQHQSAWETLAIPFLLPKSVFVLKKSLLFIPIVGLYFYKMMIAIDRSKGTHALKQILRYSKVAYDMGRPIIIFPEGTRVEPGQTRKLQTGIIAIHEYLNAPIIPVTVNSGLFWKRNAFVKDSGTITIKFHPPIEAKGRLEIMQKLENIFYNNK